MILGLALFSVAGIAAAILYLIVTIPLTRFSAWLERRMAKQR